MKSGDFNQSVSIKVYPQAHVRADGTNTLYLRVTIERKKKEINLNVHWPIKNFDSEKELALPRHSKDQDVNNVNLVINEAKGRANRIKLRYFAESRVLNLDLFAKEFETYESRDNFLFYWKNKMGEKVLHGAISVRSRDYQNSDLNRLKRFLGNKEFLSMGDITSDFITNYHKWLMKKGKGGLQYNSALRAIKTLQSYFLSAQQDGFKMNANVFAKAPKTYRDGTREVLETSELQALKELYRRNELPDLEQEVLRKFLFSCYTGIRISDSAQVASNMIKEGKLTVKMKKGERYGKEVTVKLADFALELIAGRKGQLFLAIPDATCNKHLKIIARKAKPEIEKQLSFHVSRDTFATMFIELGGDVGTLRELMGHSSIRTTQIYMKMSEKRAEKLMDNFNKL